MANRPFPGNAIVLMCAALALSSATRAQEPFGRDYYNPGTAQADRQLFENVHLYHLKPGIADLRPGRYDAALAHFEFILRVYPNQPEVLNLISELCVVRWKAPTCDADQWLERGIARNPSVATTFAVYGIHLQRKGQRADAIRALQRALEIDPASMNAHYNLGLVYFDEKNYKLANEHAQASYALGAPLPGLRQKLVKAGKWVPIENPNGSATKDRSDSKEGG